MTKVDQRYNQIRYSLGIPSLLDPLPYSKLNFKS